MTKKGGKRRGRKGKNTGLQNQTDYPEEGNQDKNNSLKNAKNPDNRNEEGNLGVKKLIKKPNNQGGKPNWKSKPQGYYASEGDNKGQKPKGERKNLKKV